MKQKAIDKFILLLVNRLYISRSNLKIGRTLHQYSSSLKSTTFIDYQPFIHPYMTVGKTNHTI